MHFGKQLKFLVFPPWKRQYIDYSLLKKSLNNMIEEGKRQNRTEKVTREWIEEKDGPALTAPQPDDNSSGTLATDDAEAHSDPLKAGISHSIMHRKNGDDDDGMPDLDESPDIELVDVVDVYPEEEGNIEIIVLSEELEALFFNDFWRERDRVDAFFQERLECFKKRLEELVALAKERQGHDIPVAPMKNEFFDLLMNCEELMDYASLNLVGFTKILKKFCHHTNYTHRAEAMRQVQRAQFVCGVPEVEGLCKEVKHQYVTVFGPHGKSGGEDPVRLMHELTHSVTAAHSWKKNTILLQMEEHMSRATLKVKEKPVAIIPLIIAFVLYIIFSFVPMFPTEDAPAQRALAILLAAVTMWASECWPLYVTSVLAIVLCLVSFVFCDADGRPLSPPEAVPVIYRALFPSSLPLIIAGFCISTAWSKYGVDVMIAMKVLNFKAFRKPATFIVAVFLICFFMSAWISNIAASMLTLTLITPVIRDLPDGCRYNKALLMAIVLGANAGGMTTQIASPQNAVTVSLGSSSLSFTEFIVVSLPVYPIISVIGYFLIIKVFPPDIDTIPSVGNEARAVAVANASSSGYASVTLDAARSTFLRENSIKSASDRTLEVYQRMTIALTILAVALWVASSFTSIMGKDIGMVSFLIIVLFTGTGLVSKAEFERLPWALVVLIAGGNCLGKAIESSKLLDIIAGLVSLLPQNLIVVMIVTVFITMLASCFVSHTIISIIILPLAAKIGAPLGHSRLMVMVSNHICSTSSPLPVSSVPNMTAVSLENSNGKPYVTTTDLLKIGLPVTLISFVTVCTVTCGICFLLGF